MDHLIGKTLGQYEITEKIGQGGMAKVFKAYQAGLDRFVAIKVLSPAIAQEAGFTERFQREAHAIARLTHPNILPVYDSGVQDDYNYLVMRYVPESRTLSDFMREDAVDLELLLGYVTQVADALNYAHDHGIIHRDIKPSNVLIDGKWALLADFGLVKDQSSAEQLTSTGIGMGTPAYMSPEQVRGLKVDHRTDIYALGVILYKILTGAIPHDASTPLAIMARRTTEPVESLRKVKPNVTPSLERVTMRALASNPDLRYSTAATFAEAVQRAYADPNYRDDITLPSTADSEPTMLGTRAQTEDTMIEGPAEIAPAPKNTGLLVGGGLAAVVIIGLLMFGLPGVFGDNATPPPPTATTLLEEGGDEPAEVGAVTTTLPTEEPPPPTPTPESEDSPTPIPPSTPQAAIKTNVEVRSGPGDDYELLGYLPAGAVAEIASQNEAGDWWQISSSLGANGFGWIVADDQALEVSNTTGLPIALAPPTPTPTVTETPTPAPPTATPTNSSTPTPTATSNLPTATPIPQTQPTATPSPTPALPSGEIVLLEPNSLDEPSYGPTEFEWRWDGPLADDQGFEVRVWQEGEPPAGVHNAVLDNQNGTVQALNDGTYRLLTDISAAAGVRERSGNYNWTVLLVQIEPEYKELGIQADAGQLRFDMPGTGGSGGGGSGGSNGGFN